MNTAAHPLAPGTVEYRPVVPVRRRDFIIKAVLITTAFVVMDLTSALVPTWRHDADWGRFPSVFTLLGATVGIIALFTTRTAGMTLDTGARTLEVSSIRLFGNPRRKQISLNGVVAGLTLNPSGRLHVWMFTIHKDGAQIFWEKENAARFDLAALQDLQRRIAVIVQAG